MNPSSPVEKLPLGKGPQRQDLHSSGQRFGEPGQKEHVGGAGQEEPAGTAKPVHLPLDGRKKLGSLLDFVDGDQAFETLQKAGRIRRHGSQRGQVVQAEIVGAITFRNQRLNQRGLPGLPCAIEQDYGRVIQSGHHSRNDISPIHS